MKRRRPNSPKSQPSISATALKESTRVALLIHDLRNCFSAIRFAHYFLDDQLDLPLLERESYQVILTSNLEKAIELLADLVGGAFGQWHQNAEFQTMRDLLSHLSAQLPDYVPSNSEDQLVQLKRLVKRGLQKD